jgi:hypothetical protein
MLAYHSCDSLGEGNLNIYLVSAPACASVREKLGLVADVYQLGGNAHSARC